MALILVNYNSLRSFRFAGPRCGRFSSLPRNAVGTLLFCDIPELEQWMPPQLPVVLSPNLNRSYRHYRYDSTILGSGCAQLGVLPEPWLPNKPSHLKPRGLEPGPAERSTGDQHPAVMEESFSGIFAKVCAPVPLDCGAIQPSQQPGASNSDVRRKDICENR